MDDIGILSTLMLAVVLGLFGFIEPCSIGSSLVMVKQIASQPARRKIGLMLVFAVTRAVCIGLLGLLAAWAGSTFLGYQRAAWLVLGVVYAALGGLYLTGHIGMFARSLDPRLQRLRGHTGSVTLGVLFGLNIPACAAPLMLALLGMSAAGGASTADLRNGFLTLAVFGLALSLPLVAATLFAPARRCLDWLADLSRRIPRWTGVVLVAVGLWSIWFALLLPDAALGA